MRTDDSRSEVSKRSSHALAREIGAIWCDVLGLNSVDPDDNFFELGGHSILAAEVVAKMRTALEVSVPLWIMLETHSLGELVERVGRALEGDEGPRRFDRRACGCVGISNRLTW